MKNNELRLAPTFVTQKNKELLEMKTDLLLLILLIPFMFVVGCRKNNNGNGKVQDTMATNMPADTVSTIEENVEVTKSSSWEDLMPQSERNLIDVLKKAWEKSEYDYTEAEKYKLIKERKNSVSNGYQMTDWVGTVFDAQYHQETNEISLVIVIYQGDDLYETIQVGTGTSADPKYRAPTTIKEGSSLFDLALELKSDDKVKFSGTLFLKNFSPWSAKRANDNPLDGFGGLYFMTKFTKLEKLD